MIQRRFSHALRGLHDALQSDHAVRTHALIALLVVPVTLAACFSRYEWALFTLSVGLVLGMELLNSALERLADVLHPHHNGAIQRVKDLAAAAVLVTAMASLGIFVSFLFSAFTAGTFGACLF